VAVKEIDIEGYDAEMLEAAKDEARKLGKLNSDFIVRLNQFYVDEEREKLCLEMEYAPEGDLEKIVE
jgi:serine/threonine protein kinase